MQQLAPPYNNVPTSFHATIASCPSAVTTFNSHSRLSPRVVSSSWHLPKPSNLSSSTRHISKGGYQTSCLTGNTTTVPQYLFLFLQLTQSNLLPPSAAQLICKGVLIPSIRGTHTVVPRAHLDTCQTTCSLQGRSFLVDCYVSSWRTKPHIVNYIES